MNRLLKLSGIAVLVTALLVLGSLAKQVQAQPGVSVSFQMFYNSLQPYGQWIDYPQHGYVWVPNVGNDFRPYYTNGHWVMTQYGNTWVSNYDWGWAPFHYGNWTYDEFYGWLWVPGTTWAPAWVSWRNGGGYYGWAPMAPGISINMAVGSYNCSPHWWVFIPQRHIYSRGFHSHWRGPRYNNTYINNTTIINNTYINNNQRYVYGPRSQEIQRATGQQVRTYGVRTSNSPGRSQVRGNSLNVYRPSVERRSNERPERYTNANERRTNSQGVMNNRPDRTATVQRSNPARANNELRSVENNRQATRTNTPPQQQERITERRQEAWQQRSQPATQQQPVNRANDVQRQRPQNNNRSAEPARPQPQQRTTPQRTQPVQQAAPQRAQPVQQAAPQRNVQRAAPQRSQPVQQASPQRNVQRAAPQRSQPVQRAAKPSVNSQRSAPANNANRSSRGSVNR